jgi:hypothetical protein|nr:MAG TPA: 50S ribosomal subunit [Bacteriophage sp.]
MSKYTEALSSIYFTMHSRVKPKTLGHCEDKNLEELEELVERATPKKPKNWKAERRLNGAVEFNCPVCNRLYTERVNFCSSCGQAIDWGK